MAKKGFYFNQDMCVGCRACQVACKDKNDLEMGTLFRHVRNFETGSFPHATLYNYAGTCNHCMDPQCVAVCPNEAMFVDEEDGTVQHNDEKCIGCGYCANACPYGAPCVIESLGVTHKCDACITLRANGEKPSCVASCTMRALEFGEYGELVSAHAGAVSSIAALPDSSETNPCVLINAKPSALESSFVEIRL